MVKTFFNKLLKFWAAWPMLFVAGCSGTVVSVVNDSSWLQDVGMFSILLSFVMMAVVVLVALVLRRKAEVICCLVAAAACAVAGFLALIMVGLGQHHPPRQDFEAVETVVSWSVFQGDSCHSHILGTDIPKGSWWTDGNQYYQVVESGKTIRMVGGTLHEGGSVCAFKVVGDSVLSTVMPREGYISFAEPGRRVTHHLLAAEDGDSVEVLVAYDEAGEEPIAALQRFDGDELKFELSAIYRALEGEYGTQPDDDGSRQAYRYLKFHADGTVQLSPDETPKPYTIELAWHSPTNVLRLPDGAHIAVEVGTDLNIFKAAYDKEEGFWTATKEQIASLWCDSKKKPERYRPFTVAAVGVMSGDLLRVLPGLLEWQDAATEPWPIPCLSAALVRLWLRQSDEWDEILEETETEEIRIAYE